MSGDEQRDVPRIVRFGIFEVDLAAGELRREGTLVKLQDQPFRLLALLLEHPGVIVTREKVRAALWPDRSFVDFEYGVNTAMLWAIRPTIPGLSRPFPGKVIDSSRR